METTNALIVRAYELAPHSATNKTLRMQLKHEGFLLRDIESTFLGKGLRQHLKALRKEAGNRISDGRHAHDDGASTAASNVEAG